VSRGADLRRVLDWDWALLGRVVDRTVETPHGVAYLTPSLPHVWDLNRFQVAESAGPDADAVVAAADEVLEREGVVYRRLVVPDEQLGATLRPRLVELGWEAGAWVYMLLGRSVGPAADVEVVEVGLEEIRAFRRLECDYELPQASDVERDEVFEAWRRIAVAAGARHFAVVRDGAPVSCADLYAHEGIAQIEDVFTLPDDRGLGLGGAVVAQAAQAARDAGNEIVFIVAEAEDRPQRLYARLGFEPAGHVHHFTLKPS
jgi:GNAT superfamily N-acetyltransferase